MESVSSGLTGDTASYSPVPRAVRIDSTKLRQRNNKTVMSNSNNSYSNSYDHYNSNSNGNGDSISYSNGNSSSRHSDSQSTEYIDGNGHSNSYTHNSTTYSHSDSYSNQDDNYSNSQDNSYPSRATNNSEIQDMSAMLGREKFSKFQAEEYCGACGLLHNRPELLDMYNFCRSCYSILRDPNHLRKKFKNISSIYPLDVLYATYGHPSDARRSIVVTEQVIRRVCESTFKDRLAFRPHNKLEEILEITYDPCPNENKQLKIRYRVDNVYATLVLDVLPNHRIPSPFLFLTPKLRHLRIFSAFYGHPKGATSTGRMSYDVTEQIQSMVDLYGGSFLSITSFTPLTRILGDPCPGYTKDLRISYEILGRAGSVTYSEVRGFPRKRIFISQSPAVTPLIFVTSATYGITPTGRRDRVAFIDKQLYKIEQLEHKKREGLALTPAEVAVFRMKAYYTELKEIFKTIPTKFIDISVKLQKLADQGGTRLFLNKEDFDPNQIFGNPNDEIRHKIIECNLDCRGHDSERLTESNEMTDTGVNRNFITNKSKRFSILVEDDPVTGQGIMTESLDFGTDTSSPVLVITNAIYGELNDVNRLIDVTHEVQNMVVGRSLTIERDVNLSKTFKKDPSVGKRKLLKINYITRGFSGNLRVREKDDCLVASVQLGYPPVPPPDDDLCDVVN